MLKSMKYEEYLKSILYIKMHTILRLKIVKKDTNSKYLVISIPEPTQLLFHKLFARKLIINKIKEIQNREKYNPGKQFRVFTFSTIVSTNSPGLIIYSSPSH